MKRAKKEFDAVATMREIRDRLSAQIEGMSFDEEKRFIRKHVPRPKARHFEEPPNTYEDSPSQGTKISSALKKRTPRKSANKKRRYR